MPDRIELEKLSEELSFRIRLQISLRRNAVLIGERSGNPERYSQYIKMRETEIGDILGTKGDLVILYRGNQIYP
ncbi:MAG: hypothetical protein M1148_00550 [Candidatus Thermoplasmatota archaeon]|nr:hypothetical protein [Candidatus Thermoplasmatota archaeon]